MVDPSAAFEQASAATVEQARQADDGQTFVTATADSVKNTKINRGSYKVIEKKKEPAKAPVAADAPITGTPDPGSAQAIALKLVTAKGWGSGEFNCLVSLWNKESG